MAAGPEPSIDLVAVACVVDASFLLASEWPRVLIEYVYPLLRRLNELHPSHQFRLAFVTYGAADTRPLPLLSKRFFAPLSLVTRELREEPSKLGIGQANSGGGRGLSALEGLVAAIELFDILMASTNSAAQAQTSQKESRSLISHLLHIAASPPDNVQRPQWNTLQHLDSLNWDSLPAELRKRKINMSLISLRKIPQFQDLHSSVTAGSGVQSPWFNVRSPHTLLLAGFPTPQKTGTKRQPDALPSDQGPDSKRQKVVADPISKTSSRSPALPSARVPQNQRSQLPASSQTAPPPPTTIPGQTSSSARPVQAAATVPATAPATAPASTSPSGPLPASAPSLPAISPDIRDQATADGLKFVQLRERLNVLERDIGAIDLQITNAQNTGQKAILAALQKDRVPKVLLKDQIRSQLWQHYQKIIAKEALNAQTGTAGSVLPDGSAEAAPPAQPHPPNASRALIERPMGPTMEEHKPAVADSQVVQQLRQSRGGTIATPNVSSPLPGPSQIQSHPAVTPEVAAQVQKLAEKKGIHPQTFQTFGSASQASGTVSRETGVHPNATNNQPVQAPNASLWLGTFSWTFPRIGGQEAIRLQMNVIGTAAPAGDVRTDLWPTNLMLNPCKEPLKDYTVLSPWLKRHQPRLMQFIPNPRAPDASVNEQKFSGIHKFMAERNMYAYVGWQLPSGKFSYNIFIFPMPGCFAGAVFHEGIPDLPGSGNALGVPSTSSAEEAKPQSSSGANIPPTLLARIQSLDPVQRTQVLTQIMLAQQENRRRQQLQQTQQTRNTPRQTLSSVGMPNPYGTVANIPASLHTNVNAPTNSGAYNPRGGTVNYEMLQSFMQRSAEGSTSQGMNSGSI